VVAILAKEISVNSGKEAIKAQAVIARTNLVGAKLSNGKEPEGLTTDQMLKLFGTDAFNGCYKKLSECVQETAGLVMLSNKKIVEAPYFAVSAGTTRSAKDAIGKDDVAYLQREESSQDITSPDFLKVEFWKLEDFVNQCNKAYPDAKLTTQDLMKQVEVTARDDSEYVNQIKLGNTTVSGEELRNALNLNSACFTIKEVEEQVRIVTKGLGHGVGLSQYGANAMALDGKDFKDILKKYYSGIQITYTE
jgi:stage II sporulation protein D